LRLVFPPCFFLSEFPRRCSSSSERYAFVGRSRVLHAKLDFVCWVLKNGEMAVVAL
jgi:hypothetical protein